MRKNLGIMIIGLILLMSSACANQPAESVEEIVQESVTVRTEIIDTDTIRETFYGVGELRAKDEIEIMTGRSGKVEEINVKVGDVIKKDQVLMKLNNDNLVASVNASESNLRTQLGIQEIQLEAAQITYDQVKALADVGASSQSDMEDATNALEQARLNYNNALSNYNLTMSNLNDEVSDSYLKSPIDGVVAARYIDLNQDVQNVMAFKIVNSDVLIAQIEVPETVIDTINVGQKTLVYLNGDKSRLVEGSVLSVDAVPGENSFLYPVEIEVDNSSSKLRSGMYIEAEVIVTEREDRIVIPKAALLGTQGNKYVFVDNENFATMRSVNIGHNKSERVEITGGLMKGERLVVSGQDYLKEGDLLNGIEE